MWEAAHGWWQTLGEVRPSWPVGGQSAVAEALPGASPDAGPTAWALREQGKESLREERRRAFPGAGTPWEKEAARLVVGPSLRGSPWRGKQTNSPSVAILLLHILTGRSPQEIRSLLGHKEQLG